MADLTPYLGGDAIKNYQTWRLFPTTAWKNSACIYNGHMRM